MTEKTRQERLEAFDYRAISDRIHAEYESSALNQRTLELMKLAYTAIHSSNSPTLEELKLRVDR